ncbi:MAG: peptide ABC transporter substrate-binding protein, partial [Acidimicrobiia bacterium]
MTVQSFEFASLDPHFSSFFEDISLQRMLWRGLYTMDSDNIPQPAMAASSPEVSADGLTYTVSLREGLKWSDGDDLTADDFVAGIYRTCNPDNAGEYEYVLVNLVGCDDHYANEAGFDAALEGAIGVTALDPTTIEFTLLEPQPTFPIILSLWMTFPSPVHLFPNSSDPWPSGSQAPGELAYNGPYILTSYSPQDSVTLEPNPEWAAPAGVSPTLDQITIKFIGDLAQAANAYRTGEIQATAADVTQLDTVISEFGEGTEYFRFVAPSTTGLYMQLEKPPLDKPGVRLALSQAIDRAELNRVVSQGGNEPTTSWIPEVSGGDPPDAFDDVNGFDPERAAENLTEAGFPNGEGFPELTILVIDAPRSQVTGEFLQQAFKTHLNIDVQIETVDARTHSGRFIEEQYELTL